MWWNWKLWNRVITRSIYFLTVPDDHTVPYYSTTIPYHTIPYHFATTHYHTLYHTIPYPMPHVKIPKQHTTSHYIALYHNILYQRLPKHNARPYPYCTIAYQTTAHCTIPNQDGSSVSRLGQLSLASAPWKPRWCLRWCQWWCRWWCWRWWCWY